MPADEGADALEREIEQLSLRLAATTERLDQTVSEAIKEKEKREQAAVENVVMKTESNKIIVKLTKIHFKRLGVPEEQLYFNSEKSLSLRQMVHSLRGVPESQIIICRRVKEMGLRAEFLVKHHIETCYGLQVEQSKLVFARSKGVFDNKDGVVKSANILFVTFASVQGASKFLSSCSCNGYIEVVNDPWLNTSHQIIAKPYFRKDHEEQYDALDPENANSLDAALARIASAEHVGSSGQGASSLIPSRDPSSYVRHTNSQSTRYNSADGMVVPWLSLALPEPEGGAAAKRGEMGGRVQMGLGNE